MKILCSLTVNQSLDDTANLLLGQRRLSAGSIVYIQQTR
jgi:hypothetical protein